MKISENIGPKFILISKHNINLLKGEGFKRRE